MAHNSELPTTPEEAEGSNGLFTLAETARITGKFRQQLQTWVKRGAIAVFDRGARGSYLLTGAQVAEIMRRPKSPNFVQPMNLQEARNRRLAQQTRRAREAAELAHLARSRNAELAAQESLQADAPAVPNVETEQD